MPNYFETLAMSSPESPSGPKRRKPRRSNEERSEQTRSALVRAARALFVENGFAATATPDIVRAAKVTRGALYHHFADKADLLQAVVLQDAAAVATHIEQRTREPASALDALLDGAAAYFEAMAVPGRARLLLQEGPAALGQAAMARIDEQTGGGELQEGLAFALDPDGEKSLPVAEMARMLSAAFDRAALAIAQGEPAEGYKRALRIWLGALLT